MLLNFVKQGEGREIRVRKGGKRMKEQGIKIKIRNK
jgi:hypothetical protein